jgi:hypothetical protein
MPGHTLHNGLAQGTVADRSLYRDADEPPALGGVLTGWERSLWERSHYGIASCVTFGGGCNSRTGGEPGEIDFFGEPASLSGASPEVEPVKVWLAVFRCRR